MGVLKKKKNTDKISLRCVKVNVCVTLPKAFYRYLRSLPPRLFAQKE